jgi:hypothetical protein
MWWFAYILINADYVTVSIVDLLFLFEQTVTVENLDLWSHLLWRISKSAQLIRALRTYHELLLCSSVKLYYSRPFITRVLAVSHTRNTAFFCTMVERRFSWTWRIHGWLTNLLCSHFSIFIVSENIVLFVFFGLETGVFRRVAWIMRICNA